MSGILASKILRKHIPEGKLLAVALAARSWEFVELPSGYSTPSDGMQNLKRNVYRMIETLKSTGTNMQTPWS